MSRYCLLLLLFLSMLAGCQDQSASVSSLPVPNLSGPVVARAAQETSRPVPQPTRRASVSSAAPRGPSGWTSPVQRHAWRYIVIHHSATPRGSAKVFDQAHRRRGWDELGYHFIIGNGTDSGNGQVEVGSRWIKQKIGAHAGVKHYNEYGIGICLVGDFNMDRPTAAQIDSLVRLVAHLMTTCHIPSGRVLGHRDIKPTDCPGRYLNVAEIRRLASQRVSPASRSR